MYSRQFVFIVHFVIEWCSIFFRMIFSQSVIAEIVIVSGVVIDEISVYCRIAF